MRERESESERERERVRERERERSNNNNYLLVWWEHCGDWQMGRACGAPRHDEPPALADVTGPVPAPSHAAGPAGGPAPAPAHAATTPAHQ